MPDNASPKSTSTSWIGQTINTARQDGNSNLTDLQALGSQQLANTASSIDAISAAGLKGINVDVDAEASITSNSTAKSTATSNNVVGDALGLAFVDSNAGLVGASTINVASNDLLSAVASTTVNAATSTSKGDAASYATIQDAAGIKDLNHLTVGGELSALGKAANTITASAETVVGTVAGAQATAELFNTQVGMKATDIDVSSNASIQGLSSLINSATADVTSGGNALAEALAGKLNGADLDGLLVGGTATVAGQSSFANTSKAGNVDGNATATSDLNLATGLVATGTGAASGAGHGAGSSSIGIDVSSDASLTGLASITSSATAATTDGIATAISDGGSLQGMQYVDAEIGGVASLTGQTSFTGAAKSTNVTSTDAAKDSVATSQLLNAGGLEATQFTNISSDATIKGLTSINESATAKSTGASGVSNETFADSEVIGGELSGAQLDKTDIGGIGNITGQVGFTSNSAATNVTGDAEATGGLTLAQGLNLANSSISGLDLKVSSDATIKGIASVTGSANAATTAGDANAAATAADIKGAELNGLVDIGGLGSISGSANFNLSAKSENVSFGQGNGLAEDSTATAGGTSLNATGLKGASLIPDADASTSGFADIATYGINVASDATLSGLAVGTLKAEALSTATAATAKSGESALLTGADLNSLHVGGIANLTGAAQLDSTAIAQNVGSNTFDAIAQSGIDETKVTGLTSDFIGVASDATISAQAFGNLNAMATSTAGDATAKAGDITGSEFATVTGLVGGANFDIGGVGSISALGQGTVNSTASTVDGIADASGALHAFGMDGTNSIGVDIASDGNITGIAKIAATVDASNIGGSTAHSLDASANGDFSATGITGLDLGSFNPDFSVATNGIGIGGVTTLKGQAQVNGTLSAESVSGDAFAGTSSDPSNIVGLGEFRLAGASDGTVLGSAVGVFNTSADSTVGDASAKSVQSLTGMGGVAGFTLDLGGNGGINAIVNDTNFVSAHSVSGNATAVASVDAIGLNGGDIHIAGNATIMANVGVDSRAEAGTIG